jgi:hypothetical protein
MLATSAAARTLLSRTASRSAAGGLLAAPSLSSVGGVAGGGGGATIRSMASIEPYSDYGKSVFTGRVADEYLKKHGSSASILKDPSWTGSHADTVAKAVLDW